MKFKRICKSKADTDTLLILQHETRIFISTRLSFIWSYLKISAVQQIFTCSISGNVRSLISVRNQKEVFLIYLILIQRHLEFEFVLCNLTNVSYDVWSFKSSSIIQDEQSSVRYCSTLLPSFLMWTLCCCIFLLKKSNSVSLTKY